MSRKIYVVFSLTMVLGLLLAACAPETVEVVKEVPVEVTRIVEVEVEVEAAGPASGYGATLAAIQDRGYLICGGAYAVPGFGYIQEDGSHVGFDIDVCRAITAAIFGDPDAIEYSDQTSKTRFTALANGELDLLSRTTTWTLTRDTELAANFTHTTFYDGQGMMVRKASGFAELEDLDGGSICVTTGTTTELNLADQFASRGLEYEPILFEEADDTWGAYEEGRCDAVTTDKSGLAARRTLLAVPDDHYVMAVTMSKEPLGPVVRHGDDQWFDVVDWVVYALIFAEEQGITSGNIDTFKGSGNPNIAKMLGEEGEMGAKLGLSNDWAYNAIKLVGNYGEIYGRHLGPDTPVFIPRGMNELYANGGLMYSPPIR